MPHILRQIRDLVIGTPGYHLGAMADFTSSLIEALERCQAANELIGIYPWPDEPDALLVGFVTGYSREDVTLAQLDSCGQYDGDFRVRLEEVVRFETDSEYIRALAVLYENRGRLFLAGTEAMGPRMSTSHWAEDLMRVKDQRFVVTLIDHNRDRFTGFIKTAGHDFVEIEELDRDNGMKIGNKCFRSDQIAAVNVNGRDQQALKFVHDTRYAIQ